MSEINKRFETGDRSLDRREPDSGNRQESLADDPESVISQLEEEQTADLRGMQAEFGPSEVAEAAESWGLKERLSKVADHIRSFFGEGTQGREMARVAYKEMMEALERGEINSEILRSQEQRLELLQTIMERVFSQVPGQTSETVKGLFRAVSGKTKQGKNIHGMRRVLYALASMKNIGEQAFGTNEQVDDGESLKKPSTSLRVLGILSKASRILSKTGNKQAQKYSAILEVIRSYVEKYDGVVARIENYFRQTSKDQEEVTA